MPRAQQRYEEVAGQRLPLGGKNGYLGIRGKQGRGKNKFQGVTPKKKHRTDHFDTPLEAAIAFAQLKEDLELGTLEPRTKKIKASEERSGTSKKWEAGTYPSATSCLVRGLLSRRWRVHCFLRSRRLLQRPAVSQSRMPTI